jgi:Putative Ig domain
MFLRCWDQGGRSAGRQSLRRRKPSFRPWLEPLEDRQAPAVLSVTTTADSGAGSLRQAILDANDTTTNPGQNTIDFNIATSGVQTISLASALPALTNSSGVILDGTSEPGFTSSPLIVLDGTGAGTSNGLLVTGGNSTIKGLAIDNFASGAAIVLASGGNTVEGDFLGTDATGTTAAGNAFGVDVASATNNTIGGTTTAARNVISGNSTYGIVIDGSSATSNLIEGNFVGTDDTGNTALGNGSDGIALLDAASNTIGGTTTGAANVISGNSRFGVFLDGTGTSSNLLEGNLIGTNQGGTAAVANGDDGVALFGGASNNTIGGTTSSAANVLSGNARFGLLLSDSGTTGNFVEGNLIGVNLADTAALANTEDGVDILNGASNNTLGGTTSGAGNTIAGNGRFGVLFGVSGTTGNVVAGNFIGTNSSSATGLGNTGSGVGLANGPTGNTIGGTTAAAANVISGNGEFGILLEDSSNNNVIQGNLIGTNQTGTSRLANTLDGIAVLGAANNTIGGTTSGADNIISGNGQVGVLIGVSGASGNLVEGNFIGTDATGTLSLPNGYAGVMLATGASSNTIGGTASGTGNTIAFNGYAGVILGNTPTDTAVGNEVSRNAIYDNSGIGIDVGNDGPTANDSAGHTGPSDFQNFPVPSAAGISNGTVGLTFTLTSVASSTFLVEFFLNNAGDSAQGRTFLGSATVTTDATGALTTISGGTVSAGAGTITLTPPTGVTPTAGQGVTATAILQSTSSTAGTAGDTSEFSPSVTLTTVTGLAISTTTLPSGTLDQPGYDQTISTTGGFGPVTFTETGTLPTGLALSTAGVLSGTPTTAGSFTFTVTATDALGDTASQTYTLVINSGVTIATTTLPDWTVNQPGYNQTISASGGTGTLTFSTTAGTLPTGLTLSSAGVLSGTPTETGSFTFTVTATDTVGASASQSYTVTINPAVTITTTTLPDWTANQSGYSQTISASGGTGTLTFSTTASTLPTGLTLSSDGTLSGTPTTSGSFTFTVTATDTVGASASQSYTVTINPAVTITTTSLADWTANQPGYSQTISASGGTGTLTFSTTVGTLPAGLTLSSAGVLSGTPTTSGSFTFTVTATDTVGASASQSYTVTINPPVTITTTSLPDGTLGASYSQTINATGGTGTLTFSAPVASLPPGLTLSSAGLLSGTPLTPGSFPFTVTASDSVGASGSQGYTVVIATS